MVQVIGHRSDLGRTQNREKRSKSQLGWDFRVVPTNNININAYMLILINKLTEISKIPDFPENSGKMLIPEFFRKFRIFCSGTNGKSIRMVRAISIPNFRIIGPLVPEKQGGHNVSPPDRFIAQNTWTGDRVKPRLSTSAFWNGLDKSFQIKSFCC